MDEPLDFTRAVVVAPPGLSGPEGKAVQMLVEEVAVRSRIRWPVRAEWPPEPLPVLAVGPADRLVSGPHPHERPLSPPGPEGYAIHVARGEGAPAALVAGSDARGVLFGVGRLLRLLRIERDRITLPGEVRIASAPRYALRGHQLGYRPKTNSYDGWTLAIWEQYLRDLAVFGCNAVELIPPRSDDADDSPHFPLPPLEMMVGMSRILAEYGLDVWIWYPAMDADYHDPATVESALQEWGRVFEALPRIDAVFVPGGDPGHTPPRPLMALLERQARLLRRSHPQAQMWVSPQGFTQEWLDEFLQLLRYEPPDWLTGIVYGPQVRISLPQLRAAVPARYPIRRYPDITHCIQCQFPVPDWDLAFAITEEREGINPQPLRQRQIFRALQEYAIGFLTYSEGCNDDVNKAVWSALGWDPEVGLIETLREYGRYFISPRRADDFAQGLLDLERNWRGPLLANAGVESTLLRFQAMERDATPQERLNWRFQQPLYRAYYDAYLRRRLVYETDLENRAMEALGAALPVTCPKGRCGSLSAMAQAEAILDRAVTEPVARELRARCFELAEALFQSIRMQLSVDGYQAISVDRGANLDLIDLPLNSRPWLQEQFAAIRPLPTEAERLAGIEALLRRTDPGPGGFYDDLGGSNGSPRVVRPGSYEEDPGTMASPRTGTAPGVSGPYTWRQQIETLYDTPLEMRYTDLDPDAKYTLRVVYAGDSPLRRIRLEANGGVEVHPFLKKPWPPKPIEFELPPAVTQSGELTLRWTREPGLGGNGRGCQVTEVWLLKRGDGQTD